MLKPLCGAEPGLYEHLRSFCLQDYPRFEIVFGIRDHNDPARIVAQRLAADFPALSIKIVVDPRLHGGNYKISNLLNMLPHAQYDLLVMADSDACVGPDYLATVTAPLGDAKVGLVTCVYRGRPTSSIWSRLGAMYINEWYVPMVLLAWLFGHRGYVSGQTTCLRRDTLHAVGGFEALVDHLADDYRLGQLVRDLRLRIVMSSYVVTGEHDEPSWESLTRHELRWMRTLQVLRPLSFRYMFFCFSVPLATLGVVLALAGTANPAAAKVLFAIVVVARLVLHFNHRFQGGRALFSDLWLVPVRDLLTCWVWCRTFFTPRVTWRGHQFDVDPAGIMRRLS